MVRIGYPALALLGALLFASAPAKTRPAAVGTYTDFGPFTIKVEIEGVTQGVFSSVEGLVSASEVIDTQENGFSVQVPGAVKGSRLILKRPYDPLLTGLWNWRQAGIEGSPERRDGHIFIFNQGGKLAAHWVFHEGWPCRWEVPALVAGSTDAAEEIVEIVHAGLSLEPNSEL
jgi:phage tail-like protein